MLRRTLQDRLLPVVLGAVVLASGCSDESTSRAPTGKPGKPTVYVVNYPLAYFAERIGGDAIKVVFPAPGDEDPAFWEPDAQAVAAYKQADLILLNGAGYAKWVDKVSLPESKLVDTSATLKGKLIQIEDALTHSHGPTGEHAHGGMAFTTWIDFIQAAEQARAVRNALAGLCPEAKAQVETDLTLLEKDLLDLDEKMRGVAAKIGKQPLVVSHPVYQYWARRYGLNVRSVHWEPDEAPDEKMWAGLKALLKDHPAKVMVWEGEPLKEMVEKLKALGIESVVFDPCGNAPDSGDYLSVMRQNIGNLKTGPQAPSKTRDQ